MKLVCTERKGFLCHVNSKSPDQLVHLHGLIRAFSVHQYFLQYPMILQVAMKALIKLHDCKLVCAFVVPFSNRGPLLALHIQQEHDC